MKTFNVYARSSGNLILRNLTIRDIVMTFPWLTDKQIDYIAECGESEGDYANGMFFYNGTLKESERVKIF